MRSAVKTKFEEAIKNTAAYRHSEAWRCWESLLEAKIEALKEDLVTAKPERVIEIQGAIKELRQILKVVKSSDAE